MYKRTKNRVCELMFLDSPLGLKISVVLIVKSMQSERCIYETTTQMRSFLIIVFRLVRDVVANHKTTRYAGAATKVIQKNHLA